MELILVSIAALLVAALTLFSGFGLGTLLMPVFALFFPLEVAVGVTAIVHLANNLFKVALVGRHASWPVALRFGLPAIPAAVVGAYLLTMVSAHEPVASYSLGGSDHRITWIGLVMGALIALFALLDLLPFFDRLQFGKRMLSVGGCLSGFFGGISGHQGALRSAFLLKWGLTRESFIATNVVCAVAVDVTRLTVYSAQAADRGSVYFRDPEAMTLVVTATLSAFVGSFLGSRWISKVKLDLVRRLVGVMLLLLAAGIAAGII